MAERDYDVYWQFWRLQAKRGALELGLYGQNEVFELIQWISAKQNYSFAFAEDSL